MPVVTHTLDGQRAPLATTTELLGELLALRDQVEREGRELVETWRPALHRRAFLPSALNLAHYIALRRRDLRGLQEALMPLGLSSLGRCEGRVMPNLDAVIASLSRISVGDASPIAYPYARAFDRGNRLLRRHTDMALGPIRRPSPGADHGDAGGGTKHRSTRLCAILSATALTSSASTPRTTPRRSGR